MATAVTADPPTTTRLPSIDLLRGMVILLMALDHARDYFAPYPHQPEDLAHASPALFLTRWITHFCAPCFVFLAGTSIYLKQHKPPSPLAPPLLPRVRGRWQTRLGASAGGGDEAPQPTDPTPSPPSRSPHPALSRHLVIRGLWLIALELTLIAASWGFLFVGVLPLGVIWALGASMILMAALVRLPCLVSLALGLILVTAHNLLDPITTQSLRDAGLHHLAPLWSILHEQSFISFNPAADHPFSPPGIFVVYPLIPWVGVMPLGYAFGRVITLPAPRRDRWCLILGSLALTAFIILRATHSYGDPTTLASQPDNHPILAFLNTTKYPPSLQYLLMTLGPAMLLLPALDRLRGPIASFLLTFGRAPLFFYLLHLPFLHITSAIFWYTRFGVMTGWQVSPDSYPPAYVPSLWFAYAAAALAVGVLFFPCRWRTRLKQRRRDWWLSYL